MIDYLRESTFAVKDVILQAWRVTRDNYLSIATLSFLIFITASTSTFMAFFMEEVNIGIKIIMLGIFVMSYCVVELCMIKYIFKLLDHTEEDVQIVDTLPTRSEIGRFLIATVYFGLSIFVVGILLMPILYLLDWVFKLLVEQGVMESYQETGHIIVNVAVAIGILGIALTFVRIIFFPFFIIDKNSPPFESIKLSLAATKGNIVKVLMILLGLLLIQGLVFGFFYIVVMMFFKLLNYFWEYDLYQQYTSLIVVTFSSFVVVPFTTAFFAVAYRKIMQEYKGDEHPDIIHNIV